MSRAVRCDGCGELSDRARLTWSASLPAHDGRPGRTFDFCSDECASDFLEERIEARARRQAERDAAPPTPSTVRALHEAAGQ